MLSRATALTAVLTLLAGCGKSGPAVTQVDPSSPLGTVWGSVLDANGQTPLSGAKVTLAIGDKAQRSTTDSSGAFKFSGVPAGGGAAVTITMDGYTSATVSFAIPGQTGNFPAEGIGAYVGPILLFATTQTVHVQVVGYDGSLIDGANVTATESPSYVDLGSSGGNLGMASVSGTTSQGAADLAGLPDLVTLSLYAGNGVVVTVDPVDTNNDGVPDYLGATKSIPPGALAQQNGRTTITLPAPGGTTALGPIASNVGSIFHNGVPRYGDSMVGAGDPIRVVFNQPVAASTLLATVWDDQNNVVDASASATQGNIVEIAPQSQLTPGGEYYFRLQARAAGTGSGGYLTQVSGWFFVPVGNVQPSVANVQFFDLNGSGFLDAGDVLNITLDRAVGRDNGGNTSVHFFLNADLDGSGQIGDARGEAGSDQPILLGPVGPTTPGPFPGLVRTWTTSLPFVPPRGVTAPYAFGTNTDVAYVIDFAGSPNVLDPEGQPLQATQGQTKVTF